MIGEEKWNQPVTKQSALIKWPASDSSERKDQEKRKINFLHSHGKQIMIKMIGHIENTSFENVLIHTKLSPRLILQTPFFFSPWLSKDETWIDTSKDARKDLKWQFSRMDKTGQQKLAGRPTTYITCYFEIKVLTYWH